MHMHNIKVGMHNYHCRHAVVHVQCFSTYCTCTTFAFVLRVIAPFNVFNVGTQVDPINVSIM